MIADLEGGRTQSGMALVGLVSRLLVIVMVAIFMVVFLNSVQGMGWRGAGFPQLVMVGLSVALLVDLVQTLNTWLKDKPQAKRVILPNLPWSSRSWLKAGAVFVGLIVLVELAQLIGFIEASVFFVAWLSWVLRIRPWYWILAYACLASVVAWLVFIEGLGVLIPRGPIF